MRRSNITGYGALEASHGERGLIDSYHIIDADMESSLRTTKRRTRTKRQQNAMNVFESYVYLLKGNIGSGLLALPQAFSYGGYALSTAFMLFIGFLSIHCMIILVKSVHCIVERWNLVTLEYGQVTEWAFLNLRTERINLGCCKVRKAVLGRIGKMVVNTFLVITQFGFGIVYFVLMSNTMDSVVKGMGYPSIPLRAWVCILLVPMILVSWIRELKSLSPLVFIANICVVLVIIVIFYDIINRLATSSTAVECSDAMSGNISFVCSSQVVVGCGVSAVNTSPVAFKQVFLFIAIAVYAFEGIGIVLPLENKMKEPEKFSLVLYSGMGTVMAVFIVVGLFGYLTYGMCVEANVTENLVSDLPVLNILYLSAQLYMGYVIYVSFATAFYVPMDFLEPPLLDLLKLSDTHVRSRSARIGKTLFHILFRSGTVVILCVLALIEPDHLADFISLVGAFASTALALIFPPVIHILVFACGGGMGSSGLVKHMTHPTDLDVSESSRVNIESDNRADGEDDNDSDGSGDSAQAVPLIRKRRRTCFRYWWVVKDVFICCFGLVCAIIGTYASMESLIEGFETKSN